MLTKKYSIAVLSLLITILMLLTACGGAATPTEEEAAPAEVEPIIIGSCAHLSGWMAAYDGPPREGALLAIDHINETGGILGRPVEFIELDGQTDAAVLGRVAQQLIDAGAHVLYMPCDFDFGAAAALVAQEHGIVGISTCASAPDYNSEALGDMQFTMSMWNTTETALASEYAYSEMGLRTAFVIADPSTEFTASLTDLFVKSWEHVGGEILTIENYTTGDMDASSLIQRFRSLPKEPDLLWISVTGPDVGAIVRQMRATGIETPFFGGDSMDTEEFYAAVGDELLNDIYMVQHTWIGNTEDPAMAEFHALWEEKYGSPPVYAYNVMGWDTVYALAAGIEAAGTTEGQAVARALEEMEFVGLSGTMDWSPAAEGELGHYPHKEAFLLMVQGGIVDLLYRGEPSWLPEP